MRVKELIEELKKVPEDCPVMASIDIIEEDGRITQLINTRIECVGYHDVKEFYPEDDLEEQQTAPEKPPKYFNDSDVFFDRFLRRVG